ncbi:MAG: PBP1A family penicillin-binding protein [Nitrospinae bacterium]|nr:PBP1A family penicillin-binding protein [Nitrospinota bacterium]
MSPFDPFRRTKQYYLAKRGKQRTRGARLAVWLVGLGLFCLVAGSAAAGGLYLYFSRDLPDVRTLRNYRPSLITRLYDGNDQVLTEFFIEKRYLVPLEQIPAILREATLAAEDSRFYSHHGLDFKGILRASLANLRAGEVVEGGSTITQQVAKTLFLTPERTLARKFREAILAWRIERTFTKEEILELYLNNVYYGHGAYGVEAAAKTYFAKPVTEVTLSESAMLAGLVRAPAPYSPYFHLARAQARRSHVLRRMLVGGFISRAEMELALDETMSLAARGKKTHPAPYFVELIRKNLESTYGSTQLYRGGLQVYTTLQPKLQAAAERALREGLMAVDKRRGWRGPLAKLASLPVEPFDWTALYEQADQAPVPEQFGDGDVVVGVVLETAPDRTIVATPAGRGGIPFETMRWARPPDPTVDALWRRINHPSAALAPGDLILVRLIGWRQEEGLYGLELHQEPLVQGALVCLESATGKILAMVGGYDFNLSQFNRAVQAIRQPGSAFKPIIYGAAMEKGFTPASVIIDSPIIFNEGDWHGAENWKPVNFEEKFYGPTTLRTALVHSRNVVTVKLLKAVGVERLVSFAHRLGITSPLTPDLSLALGSSGVSPLELTSAFAVYGNQGRRAKPFPVRKILDWEGRILEEHTPEIERVIDPEVAYIITHLLQDVIRHGTGWRVRALGRPAAGKTGTTNDFNDAWFLGFTPQLAAGVWVGMDQEKSIGKNETGSRAASPIWLAFMRDALKGEPKEAFPVPPGIIFTKVDPKTGLLAHPDQEGTAFMPFVEDTEPTNYARPKAAVSAKDLFRKDLKR